jgi:1,4-alpha-glucan branching enzyme
LAFQLERGLTMAFSIRVHFDNSSGFSDPHLWQWADASSLTGDFAPDGQDSFGPFFDISVVRSEFRFKFKAGAGTAGPWEPDRLNRFYSWLTIGAGVISPDEIWVRGDKAFVYHVEPRPPETETAAAFVGRVPFKPGLFVPDTGGLSGLGANVTADGRTVFGLYQPNAARVFVMGTFNGWQRPGADNEDPSRFLEATLHPGYFGVANTWLAVTDQAHAGDEYKFVVFGGVPGDAKGRFQQYIIDPYARVLSGDFRTNNPVIVDPTTFTWSDGAWRTPDPSRLILYEMSVHGFTDGDPDIAPANQGRFKGIAERIDAGYFDQLGVTAIALMPLAEFPSKQGPDTLGYNPSLFFTVERDFGSPDDLRELVDAAHRRGLAVLLDQVFNHTDNGFNPLWKSIIEHPDEETDPLEGGLYFNGQTDWGNRVATEQLDVQNMLIDACRLAITEYHVDGFRFDATNTQYMDHGFVLRLAAEVKRHKPDALLVAENLPNQSDLNRQGFDGFAQWSDPFHDKIKALLREGVFENTNFYNTDRIGAIFFFSRDVFAAHTNNVVNYSESHDEHSVPFEVKFNPALNNPAAKERKARLGLLSALMALGQPMIYMGQEFNVERPRNLVTVTWPADLATNGYFQWAHRLVRLRRRYPGLRIAGATPAETGQFRFVMAPWLGPRRGGGQRAIGWQARPNAVPNDALVVLLNFENHDVLVDVDLGIPGVWVKLADIDFVNDIAPEGTNGAANPTALHTRDGNFGGFVLPSSSGFVYKWEAP